MDVNNFKSIALNVDSYNKLKHLAQHRFEMPQSMAKVVAFLINQAFMIFKKPTESEVDAEWDLIKDFEPI